MTPVIELHDLSFAFDGEPVLKNVNLVINQRDSVCVVGPNGGGKSTLIKLILGLLTPTHGKVILLGGEPEEKRELVGYVPQYASFDPLFPVTVLDVALMGRLVAKGKRRFGFSYSRADKAIAMEALAQMGLSQLAGKMFAGLSGGLRQRVLIARALASAAEMLILDEPTSNIDSKVEVNLFEIMAELNKKMAIILVTHDLGFASQFFQSVICVNREVKVHPTSAISGEIIQDLYGGDISMIRHDHRCTPGGHICE